MSITLLAGLVAVPLVSLPSANAAVSPAAPISAVETPVSENFDTLNSTTPGAPPPAGWGFIEDGTNADDAYTLNDGSSTTGDTYSYGITGSADRALGALRSGSVRSELFGVYRNETGQTITSVTINYSCELWRLGALDRLDRLAFFYSTDNTEEYIALDAADCVTPPSAGLSIGPVDGNVFRTAVTAEISGLSIPPTGFLVLNWADLDVAGFDDGLAIDDFSIVAHSAAGPAPCSGGGSGAQSVQCTTASVTAQPPGELAIVVANANVSFGDITAGQTSAPAEIGNIAYTNTLDNGQSWSATVAATSLVDGSEVVPFSGMTFTPGEVVTPTGPTPGASASFTGVDTTPGSTYSDPSTLVTAQPTDQGEFTHSGSTATLSVPSGAASGTYSGTLQYTITG